MQMFLDWHVSQCPPPPETFAASGLQEDNRCVLISTIDNPGWNVGVKITATNLEGAEMTPVKLDIDDRWIICEIIHDEFVGIGDQYKLITILQYFHELFNKDGWKAPPHEVDVNGNTSHLAERLQAWYAAQCQDISDVPPGVQPWHDRYGLSIYGDENRCWRVEIDISGTNLEHAAMSPVNISYSPDDWMRCEITTDDYGTIMFCGEGDPGKLLNILACFFELADNAA